MYKLVAFDAYGTLIDIISGYFLGNISKCEAGPSTSND